MGNLVVKDNALIEASYKLGEVEQRLILLAILKARNECKTVEQLQGKELIIYADDYIKVFGVDKTTAYRALKNAVMGLFEAKWGYKYITDKGEQRVRYERFTQSADYGKGEGYVIFKFADAIIPMLMQLERNFTTYEIGQVANLSSSYAMRLYEFFMQHLDKKTSKGWLDISLINLRFRFGLLPTEYERMFDFKRYVLDLSIKEINKKTDLLVTYEQKKQGRMIIGFHFDFNKKRTKATSKTKQKEQERDNKTVDIFDGLTDLERQAIQSRIDDYIAMIESKGEVVSDFYRQNIIRKAIAERWGLDEFVKKQEKKQAIKEQKNKEFAERLAEQQREELEKQEREKQRNEIIQRFESLTAEQQEFILDEVAKKATGIFAKVFADKRKENTAHQSPMFADYFKELLF